MGCWSFGGSDERRDVGVFGGMGEDPMGGGRGFSFLINY